MSDLKITVDQLKNYLGTGLEFKGYGEFISISNYIVWCAEFKDKTGSLCVPLSSIQPICYRLSDLDKEIEHNGERFVPLYELIREFNFHKDDIDTFGLHTIPFGAIQDLLKWHFWPFGDEYFEKGLVIDKRKEAHNS